MGSKKDAIIFLVPTLNEGRNIRGVLEKIAECDFVKKTVVIDGGSMDNTISIVKEFGHTIIHQQSKGKGAAVLEALSYFKPIDRVIMIDGDGTYDPREADQFTHLMGEGVLVNGSRFKGKIVGDAMTLLNFVGNQFLTFSLSLLYDTFISDFLSGMKGFVIKDMRSLNLESRNFEIETEIVAKYLKKFKVVEVPITYYPRGGKSKLNPIIDGFRILKRIIQERLRD